MKKFPCELRTEFEWHGKTVVISGFQPCGRGFTVRFYDKAHDDWKFHYQRPWREFEREAKSIN